MYSFARNMQDYIFILKEYNRLKNIYNNKIYLHNYDENLILIKSKTLKINWNPFYKNISESNDNDVIIKCDDDILFIDMNSLKNAINNRINDNISFIIHSNCINNGVCAYYQKYLFPKIKDELNKYPIGGLLGVLFEKPEIAYVIHNQFSNDICKDLQNINKYIIDDIYINNRISINFILINGSDTKYLKDISTDDEYQLSGFIPESLGRPNKIKGDLLTSHLSYSFQDKILLNKNDIINNYIKIKDKYINNLNNIIVNYNINNNLYIPKYHITNNLLNDESIFKIKQWYTLNHYYIKHCNTDKYLSIDYQNDEFYLSNIKKTAFQIIDKNNNNIEIRLGIYNLTRYNYIGKFRNEIILMKYIYDEKERELTKEDIDINNSFYLKFIKYNLYLSIKNNKDNIIDITINKNDKWYFENVDLSNEYINCTRIINNNKIYYKNIETNEVYTNYYKGWGIENVLW